MSFTLNKENRSIIKNGKEEKLTPKEFVILSYLIAHPDTIHTAEEIYKNVWDEIPFNCKVLMCVHIRHIREKIEDNPSTPIRLDSFWKKGYRFNGQKKKQR